MPEEEEEEEEEEHDDDNDGNNDHSRAYSQSLRRRRNTTSTAVTNTGGHHEQLSIGRRNEVLEETLRIRDEQFRAHLDHRDHHHQQQQSIMRSNLINEEDERFITSASAIEVRDEDLRGLVESDFDVRTAIEGVVVEALSRDRDRERELMQRELIEDALRNGLSEADAEVLEPLDEEHFRGIENPLSQEDWARIDSEISVHRVREMDESEREDFVNTIAAREFRRLQLWNAQMAALMHGEIEDDDDFLAQRSRASKVLAELLAKIALRRHVAFGELHDYQRATQLPKNWRMGITAVPAEHRRGLRVIFVPGRVWLGTIWIPGSEKKSRYMFRVLFWDHGNLVCSHAAQGDEQMFYLRVKDKEGPGTEAESSESLHLSFRDNETFCDGELFPNGVIKGKVRQMIRGSEGHYEPSEETMHFFKLKIARWTENAEAAENNDGNAENHELVLEQNRKLRDLYNSRKRWAMSRDVLPCIMEALDFIKGDSGQNNAERKQMLEVMTDSTQVCGHLLSFAPETVSFKLDNKEIAECQDNTIGGHEYLEPEDMLTISLEDDPIVETMMFYPHHDYRSLNVEYLNEADAFTSKELHYNPVEKEENRHQPSANKEKFTKGVNDPEIKWYQVWEVAKLECELLCCQLREQAIQLQEHRFETPQEKLLEVKSQDGVKHKAHKNMNKRIVCLMQLIWRSTTATTSPPTEREQKAIRMGAFAMRVIESRMFAAYQLLDDSLKAYFYRLPLSEIERRVSVYTKDTHNDDDDNNKESQIPCSICVEDFREGDKIITLDCQHRFHDECCRNWFFARAASCPNCRAEIDDGVESYMKTLTIAMNTTTAAANTTTNNDNSSGSSIEKNEEDEDEDDYVNDYEQVQREYREMSNVHEHTTTTSTTTQEDDDEEEDPYL